MVKKEGKKGDQDDESQAPVGAVVEAPPTTPDQGTPTWVCPWCGFSGDAKQVQMHINGKHWAPQTAQPAAQQTVPQQPSRPVEDMGTFAGVTHRERLERAVVRFCGNEKDIKLILDMWDDWSNLRNYYALLDFLNKFGSIGPDRAPIIAGYPLAVTGQGGVPGSWGWGPTSAPPGTPVPGMPGVMYGNPGQVPMQVVQEPRSPEDDEALPLGGRVPHGRLERPRRRRCLDRLPLADLQ